MVIKINNVTWEIKELNEIDDRLRINDVECKGTTHYGNNKIYIYQNMPKDQKFKTLIHELCHAFLDETQISEEENKSYTNENVCDFVGKYAEEIVNIANKYFKR